MARLIKQHKWNGKSNKDSGTLLAEALCISVTMPKVRKAPHDDILLNWGLSSLPDHLKKDKIIINHPDAVKVAVNKLATLKRLKEMILPIPTFTTDIDVAKTWIDQAGFVVCRTLLSSSSGKGIVIAKTKEELVPAPLYTLLYRKKREFRVHVVDYSFYIQQKKRMTAESLEAKGISSRNKYVRNLQNGYIYSSDHDISLVDEANIVGLAINSINALDLVFGAVDIMECVDGTFRILEINTAPGLKNTKTLEFYINELSDIINV